MKNSKITTLRKSVIRELDKLPNNKRIQLPLNILKKIVFTKIEYGNKEGELISFMTIALSNEYLRKLDLSELDFRDVDVLGYNFEGTNAKINPQIVHNKDFYGINVKGLDMSEYDFTDVDIRQANLNNTGAKIDLGLIRYSSIEGTKLDDTSLVGTNTKTITDVDIKKLEDVNYKVKAKKMM